MSTIIKRKVQNGNEKKSIDLSVIGAGLPGTGISTLKAAFEILGFGPCHHIIGLFEKPSRTIEFIRAFDGENIDFYQLMKGYGSTVDFYKEIHQIYPQAKIILTIQDTDEKWFESFQQTLGFITTNKFYYFCIYPIRFLRLQYILSRKIILKWKNDYDEINPLMHSKHNQRIINENKKNEILIFNVKEGWEPLCKFLNVDIPNDISFPNINDTNEFKYNIIFAKVLGLSAWFIIGLLFILSSYLIIKTI